MFPQETQRRQVHVLGLGQESVGIKGMWALRASGKPWSGSYVGKGGVEMGPSGDASWRRVCGPRVDPGWAPRPAWGGGQ